jgi:preprotein translocase subunit SecE
MTVAEATGAEKKAEKAEASKKMEKTESQDVAKASWAEGAMGWGPRKWNELKSFLGEVRAELKKVTWPGKQEVYATTIIIVATTVFFGFFLYGLDLLFSQIATRILR